jgi:hypothetical protein
MFDNADGKQAMVKSPSIPEGTIENQPLHYGTS